MKCILSLACILLFSTVPLQAQKQVSTDKLHRVIIQLTSGDSLAWKGVVRNIKHLKETWGDNVQIEVVAHGAGIEFLVTSKTTQQQMIALLAGKGVVFFACENTMKDRKIMREDILNNAGTVPSGVVEVVTKEEQGWSYLKAGQ